MIVIAHTFAASRCVASCIATIAISSAVRGADPLQFPPGELTTASGKPAKASAYNEAASCATCHEAQEHEWKGSIHSRSHQDGIYKAFADLAREEGGDKLYVFCSSCHAPAAVATGEIPGKPGGKHTFLTDEGVTCDVCHSVKDVRKIHQNGGANGSIVLDDSDNRYGPFQNPSTNDAHTSVYSELHTKAQFCSACHTLTHPYNGTVIENTFQEWEKGPLAQNGVQCQDCHMRTVAQAVMVAKTLAPIPSPGKVCDDCPQRPDVHAHLFTGGSVNRELNGTDELHATEAQQRLQTAARIAIRTPEKLTAGGTTKITVDVSNESAGHAIPTSITELRQVWIDVQLSDAAGKILYQSGAIRADGSVDPDAVMFHSVLADAQGKITYRPWLAEKILSEKLIPPKQTVSSDFEIKLPAGAKGPFNLRAVLRYRSAPQDVMDQLFGAGKFKLRTVDMAIAESTLPAG
jgi:hypothetical protein